MPITVERNGHNDDADRRIGVAMFGGSKMMCIAVYGKDGVSPASGGGDRRRRVEEEEHSSSSSIGKNSDNESSVRSSLDREEGEEVQSKCKQGALDNLQELEKVLPMKRSISQFYTGKSKSFTSLGEAVSCTTIKDIVKPENAYSRKRKNLLAYQSLWEKNCNGIHRSNSGGKIKRHMSSRGTSTPVPMKSCAESRNNSNILNSNLPPRGPSCLPPLPPPAIRSVNNDMSSPSLEQKISPLQSSSSDLEDVAAVPGVSGGNNQ